VLGISPRSGWVCGSRYTNLPLNVKAQVFNLTARAEAEQDVLNELERRAAVLVMEAVAELLMPSRSLVYHPWDMQPENWYYTLQNHVSASRPGPSLVSQTACGDDGMADVLALPHARNSCAVHAPPPLSLKAYEKGAPNRVSGPRRVTLMRWRVACAAMLPHAEDAARTQGPVQQGPQRDAGGFR
jgi:hypothetical protein